MKWTKLSLLLVLTVIVALNVSTIDVADATPRLDPLAAVADKGENSMPLKVDRLDPSVDRIIPSGATLERVATGFTWLEGPVSLRTASSSPTSPATPFISGLRMQA